MTVEAYGNFQIGQHVWLHRSRTDLLQGRITSIWSSTPSEHWFASVETPEGVNLDRVDLDALVSDDELASSLLAK